MTGTKCALVNEANWDLVSCPGIQTRWPQRSSNSQHLWSSDHESCAFPPDHACSQQIEHRQQFFWYGKLTIWVIQFCSTMQQQLIARCQHAHNHAWESTKLFRNNRFYRNYYFFDYLFLLTHFTLIFVSEVTYL